MTTTHQTNPDPNRASDASPEPTTADAMRRTRVARFGGRYSWIAMGLLWLLLALNANMRLWITGSLQPAIIDEYGISPSTVGLFVGLLTLAQGLFVVPIASWVNGGGVGWARKYRYASLVAAYVLLTLATGINLLTGTLLALFVIQFLHKVVSGAGESTEVTIINEWWPVEKRGFAQGLHHTAYPWGTFIGGLAVAGILSAVGSENWRVVFLTLPLLAIPVFLIYWKFSTGPRYAAFTKETVDSGLTPPLTGNVEGRQTAPPNIVRLAAKNPNVVVPSVVFGITLAVYTGISLWLPLYLAFVANYGVAQIAALAVVFTITGGIGQIFWGAVSDRLGRKLCLIIIFAWLAGAVCTLQFVGDGIVQLILFQLLVGFATNGAFPLLFAMSADSIDRGGIGTAMSFNMAGGVIAGLGPILIGVSISVGGGYSSVEGFTFALYVMSGLIVLCAVLMLLFTRETIGWFKDRDRALVSTRSCLRAESPENEQA